MIEQLDYRGKLTKQFPVPKVRVVYNKSGMHLTAAPVTDRRAVINNGLYWTTVGSEEEANYLCAILNSPVTTEFVRPLMSYGKDERDIHKHVWQLPIPEYSADNEVHGRLASLGQQGTALLNEVIIAEDKHFSAQRRQLRKVLSESAIGDEIDQIVYEYLS